MTCGCAGLSRAALARPGERDVGRRQYGTRILIGDRLEHTRRRTGAFRKSAKAKVRGIVNRRVRERGPLNAAAPAFPLATSAIAPLRTKAEGRGSGDFSPLWSGQNASGCEEVPAAQLTRELTACR